jgi:hypothetical protein
MSPNTVAEWPLAQVPGIGLPELRPVLLDADLGIEKTGIEFPALDGIAYFALPPHATIHLVGAQISAGAVGAALLHRPGMAQIDREGLAIFTEGEDNETNFLRRDPRYPFGEGWRAHRVAVWNGNAVVTFSWEDLTQALAQIGGGGAPPGPGDAGWRLEDLVTIAAAQAPDGAQAFAATGLPARTFQPTPGVEPEGGGVPEFGYALYIGWALDDREAIQMVLTYRDSAAAEIALTLLIDRFNRELSDRWPADTQVDSSVASIGGRGTVVALISTQFPSGATDHPAARELGRWYDDALSRRLQLLSIAP